jgi:hypothetical protein
MKRLKYWFKNTSTHKRITAIVYAGCAVFVIIVMIGWFCGLDNAVGMMNCAAMVVVVNSVQYPAKAGFEHSKWATPLTAGIASGLSSGDPVTGLQNAVSAYQTQTQMEQMTEQGGQVVYNDPSAAPPPENMPADNAMNYEQSGGGSAPQ